MTNDEELSNKCRKLRNLAFEPNGRRFIHNEMGWNYRMTNLQAAMGLAQLENIEKHIRLKIQIGAMYQDGLKVVKGYQLPLDKTDYAENIYWVFGLVADSQELCDKTVRYLTENNIGTRPFFWCMHEQPVFLKMGLFSEERYPVAENLARCGFYLPSGLGISKNEINLVIKNVLNGL
jgi:perosamine synthetase